MTFAKFTRRAAEGRDAGREKDDSAASDGADAAVAHRDSRRRNRPAFAADAAVRASARAGTVDSIPTTATT